MDLTVVVAVAGRAGPAARVGLMVIVVGVAPRADDPAARAASGDLEVHPDRLRNEMPSSGGLTFPKALSQTLPPPVKNRIQAHPCEDRYAGSAF